MNKSKFQFSNPTIEHIKFEKFKMQSKDEINFNYKINSNVKTKKSIESNRAKVYLTLYIGNKDKSVPFDLEITLSAFFKWDEDVDSARENALLSKNAPALLLSYARPVISLILSQAGFPDFNIPFMDFTGNFSGNDATKE